MRYAIVVLVLALAAGKGVQAQTKLEDVGLSSPRTLSSRFLDEHWTVYKSLLANAQSKDEFVG